MSILAEERSILVDTKYIATPKDIHIYEAMFSLSHILRKTVTKKNLAAPSYMGVILHTIDQLIGEKPESGFIKHGVVYVKIADQGKKMKLFQDKASSLKKIQETLDGYGYQIKIQDIRFVQ